MGGRQGGVAPEPWEPANAVCLLVLGALVAVFYGQRLAQHPEHVLGGIDIGNQFAWTTHYATSRLAALELPLWNPHSYCGHPFLADPATAVFYPSTLLGLLLPLRWTFGADMILHSALAAAGMFVLVRTLSSSALAALAAGILYGFNGYIIDRVHAGHLIALHAYAWMPWVLYAMESASRARTAAWTVAAAVFLALEFLGGDLQTPYYFGVTVLIYAAARALAARTAAPLCVLAVAAAIALLLGAIQLFPSLEFFSLSDRAASDYRFATFFSLPPANLATLLVPQLTGGGIIQNWELTCYLGLPGLAFAAVGAWEARPRWLTATLLFILVFGLTVMLGFHTPVYRLYYAVLPGLASFRIPARAGALAALSISILAGLGLAACLDAAAPPRRRWLLAACGAAVVLAVAVVARTYTRPAGAAPIAIAYVFAAAPLLLVALWDAPRLRALGAGVVAGAIFVDLLVNFGPRVPLLKAASIEQATAFERTAQEGAGAFRIASAIGPGRAVGLRYDGVNAFTPMAVGEYFRFVHEMAGLEPPPLMRHTLLPQVFDRDLPFWSQLLNVRFRVDTSGRLVEQQSVTPRAVLADEAIVEPDPSRHAPLLRGGAAAAGTAVVDQTPTVAGGIRETAVRPGAEGARIAAYGPERVEVETNAPRRTYLVLSDQYYPGWRASVDGVEAPILRANAVFRAVALPPGAHTVVFSYRPWSFTLGAAVSGMTVLAIGTWWWRRGGAPPPLGPQ